MRLMSWIALVATVAAAAAIGVVRFAGHDLSGTYSPKTEAPTAPPAMPPPETFAAIFTPCAHCHEIGSGARPMAGPPLTGIIGRNAASYPHYPYSPALRNSGLTWNDATLARFIADPQAVVPGTRMIFGGLPKGDIAALISFIKTAGADDAATKQEASLKAAPNASASAATLPPSTLAIGGPFELIDTKGHKVTQNDLLGKPSALFFGYTYCPDICPTTLAELTRLMKELGPDADKLNVVFVTIDPARDTAGELATYLSSFDPRIRGLTGTAAQIATIAKAYHVYYARVAGEGRNYSMDHTATVYLMNAKGGFVGTLSTEEDDRTSLAKLQRLVRGAS